MRSKSISKNNKFMSRKQAPTNYLIVCEGEKTEPNYFNGLKKKINEKYGNKIDVLIPDIDVKGTGMNTMSLINYTKKVVNYSNKEYGSIWVVFDKDDYSDVQFDQAVNNCSYNVGWSNPNFELWLLSHFKKVDRFISKDKVLQELSIEFKKNGLGNYTKNDKNIFDKVVKDGRLDKAIKNCESMEKLNTSCQASQKNPMTKVYKIVNELKEYL